jgi:hypothetical protein
MGVPCYHEPTLHFFGECFFKKYSHGITICKLQKSSNFLGTLQDIALYYNVKNMFQKAPSKYFIFQKLP